MIWFEIRRRQALMQAAIDDLCRELIRQIQQYTEEETRMAITSEPEVLTLTGLKAITRPLRKHGIFNGFLVGTDETLGKIKSILQPSERYLTQPIPVGHAAIDLFGAKFIVDDLIEEITGGHTVLAVKGSWETWYSDVVKRPTEDGKAIRFGMTDDERREWLQGLLADESNPRLVVDPTL